MSLSRIFLTFIFIIGFVSCEIKNKGWWKNSVLYQIFPRSFKDSNGDGNGDLKGIISKLDHFVDLGIGVIWMSPVNTSPLKDNGYDISDYYNIDPAFGSLEDYEELLKKAKKLGIKVIMDFVPNHTSDQHQWFINSVNGVEKYKDYYVWRRGRKNNTEPPNNWVSYFFSPAWSFNKQRDLWYLRQFQISQTDLNFTNPDVQEEMREILKFWLDKGVDGFRIDAPGQIFENKQFLDEPLSHIPGLPKYSRESLKHIYTENDPRDYDLVASWRKLVDDWTDSHDEEEKIIIVESFIHTTKYYHYGVHVPFNFNFLTLVNDLSKPSEFKDIIDTWIAHVPQGDVPNWVTSTHDLLRITSRYRKKPELMITLVMILPGVACVYYGEEIAMEDNMDITWEETQDAMACSTNPQIYKKNTRDPGRTPFQWGSSTNANFSSAEKTWLPINKNYVTLNLENQKSQPNSPYNFFKTLSKLKRSSETLRIGSLKTEVLHNDKVLVVSRQLSTEGIVLLYNFSDYTQIVDASDYLPGADNATVIVSSRNSNITWGSSVNVFNVEIPPTAGLVLVGTIETSN